MCFALDMPCGASGIYLISKRSYIEWAQPIYRICASKYIDKNTRCSLAASGVFCRACGTAHADPVGQLHSQIRSTSAKQPPSLRGRRPWQSESPAVQRAARPRRGRKENGLPRAYALAMTAVDGSRCFCREIAVVASGRRGQCRTPYGVIKDLKFVRQFYGRSGRTGRR